MVYIVNSIQKLTTADISHSTSSTAISCLYELFLLRKVNIYLHIKTQDYKILMPKSMSYIFKKTVGLQNGSSFLDSFTYT